MTTVTPRRGNSFLATRRGKLTLALLCAVAFLDFVDGPIVNVALPSIRHALHFSVANLQWVPSGYLLTYGGFMLLGGRMADLLGRRRILLAGIVMIGISSLIGGFAQGSGVLVGARLAQGLGAAMTLPAALSRSFVKGSAKGSRTSGVSRRGSFRRCGGSRPPPCGSWHCHRSRQAQWPASTTGS